MQDSCMGFTGCPRSFYTLSLIHFGSPFTILSLCSTGPLVVPPSCSVWCIIQNKRYIGFGMFVCCTNSVWICVYVSVYHFMTFVAEMSLRVLTNGIRTIKIIVEQI